ncbi:hypothetical protein QFZ82_001391 [Streptomyces sp. V4I23]|uniref:hypothetical protein n=1 Tax=Streptomyces sp. V4I23 TaxID=3042282 RepID=UPI00278B01F7|nr:hypothetical protein [Streptomyces sp. V4I23]MDQ1006906.1 hypothetical protein [Streptomyces sp. V4I23]
MGVGIGLLVLGMTGVGWGAMFLFNLRGAADKAAARRNAVRAVTAARTMDLGLTEPSRFGPWFFRLVGGMTLPGGLLLGFVGLVLAFAE